MTKHWLYQSWCNMLNTNRKKVSMTFEYLPSPCLSVNWKALTSLNTSSTLRPTGRSFTVICRTTPCNGNHELLLVHSYSGIAFIVVMQAQSKPHSLSELLKTRTWRAQNFLNRVIWELHRMMWSPWGARKALFLKFWMFRCLSMSENVLFTKTAIKNITIKVGLNTTIMVDV